jgi:DNA-binding winged helix-turn-helix (wHTH) protein
LGEDPKQRQYIETVPKRGYRFIADVKIVRQQIDDRQTIDEAIAIDAFSENADEEISHTGKTEVQELNSDDQPFLSEATADLLMKM